MPAPAAWLLLLNRSSAVGAGEDCCVLLGDQELGGPDPEYPRLGRHSGEGVGAVGALLRGRGEAEAEL